VQAHTLGEVGNLGTVLLKVYSRTVLPIFVEIGVYLTDKEQNISWHSFFETRCIILYIVYSMFNRSMDLTGLHIKYRMTDYTTLKL